MKIKPPIYSGVKGFISKQRILFTTPGHNGKVILNQKNFCKLDSASSFETDNLDAPVSYILESEYQLMKMYKTTHSYYITNGSSCGIMAMIGSVMNPGDKIIVDRDCHKSVIDAIMLNRLIPVFINREYNTELGFNGGFNKYSLESTLSSNTDAKAIFITSPTHYGIMANIGEISDLAYKHNMLLLVDESHGAHLPFGSDFPPSALEMEADMVLHNAGETLGSMSGGAILHINNETIDLGRVRNILYTYQSPEASNAYLCALENSIYYVSTCEKKYGALIKEIQRCRQIVNDGTDIVWYDGGENEKYSIDSIDPTRIILNFGKIGMSGIEACDILRNKYNIEPEIADGDNLVLVASVFNSAYDIRKLMNAILKIYKGFLKTNREPCSLAPYSPVINNDITLICPPCNTQNCDSDWAGADNVTGMICKRTIYSYPTYTPLIIPGERIDKKHLISLDLVLDGGSTICGLTENNQFEVVNMSYAFKL